MALKGDDIVLKFGDRNFGADPNLSFSYASSRLFNKIAKLQPESLDLDLNGSKTRGQDRNPYTKRKTDGDKPCERRHSNSWLSQPTMMSLPIDAKQDAESDREHLIPKKKSNTDSVPHKEVHDLWQRTLELDPELYKPPAHCDRKAAPVVHYLTRLTRPERMRQLIPVLCLFSEPLANFWSSKFLSFNELQSELARVAANSDESLVVSAPTAAGKTGIFEMAICRLLSKSLESMENAHIGSNDFPNSKKILYIAPNKALCEERCEDWTKRLQSINPTIEIALVTGDSDSQSFSRIASSHLILTTPEKWDSITRRWTDHFFLIGSIKLLLIDEIHMLGDEQRGACLESLICRMKTVQRAVQSQALSKEQCNDVR